MVCVVRQLNCMECSVLNVFIPVYFSCHLTLTRQRQVTVNKQHENKIKKRNETTFNKIIQHSNELTNEISMVPLHSVSAARSIFCQCRIFEWVRVRIHVYEFGFSLSLSRCFVFGGIEMLLSVQLLFTFLGNIHIYSLHSNNDAYKSFACVCSAYIVRESNLR